MQRKDVTEFTEGINTYRVVPIIMQDKNADKVIDELKHKRELGEMITKADLLPLVLCPLMSGTMSQKERVIAAYDITRKATGVDAKTIREVATSIEVAFFYYLGMIAVLRNLISNQKVLLESLRP